MTRLLPAILILLAASAAAAQEPLPERSLAEVIELTTHGNPAVRLDAVRELGRRGDGKALAPLIERLGDAEPVVRAHAAEALRAVGDERAVPHLAKALEDTDGTVRARAALALGDLGGKYVLPALTRMLADPVSAVRAAAVRALGEIGDPLSLAKVLDAQRTEKEDVGHAVTAAALIAAAKLGGGAGLDASLAIAKKKLPESWLARASAAHAVGITGDADRVPFLEASLAEDTDPRVCQSAAKALGALGATEALIEALGLEKGYRRRAAVTGLADLPGKVAEAALVKATTDDDPGVRLEAGAALLGRGRREAFPVLIALLEEEATVWLGAVSVLESRSGLDFGRDPARWKAWFEESRERLVFDAESGRYRAR